MPFGSEVGDHQLPPEDDDCSSVISLPILFPIYGTNESRLYVSEDVYQNTEQWHFLTYLKGFGPLKYL